MLNDRQKETLEQLSVLKKEVDLLESHRIVFPDENEQLVHITQKQYNESGNRIVEQLTELEHQYGIYEDNSINRKFKLIRRTLDEIESDLLEMKRGMDEELYNLKIQMTIDEVIDEIDVKNT